MAEEEMLCRRGAAELSAEEVDYRSKLASGRAGKYNTVLSVCCLRPDLAILPNSDLTEIGERGANLSGGQRQRISLARALYSDRSIFMLDDPLSALDAHVGNHIFNSAIKKHLKSKTILFITHQLQYLVDCDEVIYMKEGCISERGTHEDLIKLNGEYATIFNNFQLGEAPHIEVSVGGVVVCACPRSGFAVPT
ncbi:unnamed protein product [Ranitomeya imitator]|uniref:ABC transporter domain-containing protein n=1 Tax=Ranitomeya imitator TaxID=111125 RepID=A0ABN9LQ32_9NEOB|nr:unnamed protein product [Ranitomeya imitator]